MILILPNIKNSKLMNFRSLKPLSNSTLAAMEFAKKFKDVVVKHFCNTYG